MNNGVLQSIFPIWEKSFTYKKGSVVNREKREVGIIHDSPK